jgi:hypothetical protein
VTHSNSHTRPHAKTNRMPLREVGRVGRFHVLREMTEIIIPELNYRHVFRTLPKAQEAFLGMLYGPTIERQEMRGLSQSAIMQIVVEAVTVKPDYYRLSILHGDHHTKSNPLSARRIRIPVAQIRRGTRMETTEHRVTRRIGRKIALDHLREHPRYYEYLEKMERAMKTGKRVCFNPLLNPYPHEHAARIISPDRIIPSTFRSKYITPFIRIIIGKTRAGGPMVVQAFRFRSEEFTAAQAKAWLKRHHKKALRFEAASA